ncbi:MAG: hypothetical protein JW861_14000 [Bacteroidales bacterium]|nr:hypothetical protein [Bacteroidales bacterium]
MTAIQILLPLSLMFTIVASGQSATFNQAVKEARSELTAEGFAIQDEDWWMICDDLHVHPDVKTFNAHEDYIFLALVDDCPSCPVKLYFHQSGGDDRYLDPEIERAEGITRVAYYFSQDYTTYGEMRFYVDSQRKYRAHIIIAKR